MLSAQRDRYLPLRVIRDQFEALDRGERVVGMATPPPPPVTPPSPAPPEPAPSSVSVPAAVPAPAPIQSPAARMDLGGDTRLTRTQLAERAGLDEAGVADLEQYGLLVPGPSGYYGGEALTVARIAAQLAEYGLEARHLRPYRATADREVGLLAQLVPPLARQAAWPARARGPRRWRRSTSWRRCAHSCMARWCGRACARCWVA